MRCVRRSRGIPGSVGVGGLGWGDTGVEGTGSGSGSVAVEGSGKERGRCLKGRMEVYLVTIVIMGGYKCSYCKNFYLMRDKGPSQQERHPSDCGQQCSTCKKPNCQCPCRLKKRSASASSQSDSNHVQYVIADEGYTSAQTYTKDTSTSLIPIIIVPVALIILVICVMIYFRIWPFHRVRYLLRS
ncbi:hypothetical protein, conserved [Babesia bigemina]|uniref:Uncharacterized protein n=1 Tax=Babesia bigemina TaxID=5866 RepID=A0A061BR58_BABBI|nr:hypothetical protein, conserved [Babesia bigemina]CDR71933.1 hypothetical protein, conserved [Babesia bigemina]|eukprot:XP_012770875.1 hypothetical protein, conserved [Babesia bigemina]